MSDKLRKNLQEKYNRLKKVLKRVLAPQREESLPQLILQPYKKNSDLKGESANLFFT
jgi:hypothetical protein